MGIISQKIDTGGLIIIDADPNKKEWFISIKKAGRRKVRAQKIEEHAHAESK